jgi:excinuclease ABC subunit C
LIVIDGGKGQLAAGLHPLRGFRERGVTVVSLAKRIEEVFIPGRAAPLVLDHSTPELQLLQRVRDEAHRFAITGHRRRRARRYRESILETIPGLGPTRRRSLLTHFGGLQGVLRAGVNDLEKVSGVGGAMARSIYEHLHPGE